LLSDCPPPPEGPQDGCVEEAGGLPEVEAAGMDDEDPPGPEEGETTAHCKASLPVCQLHPLLDADVIF